MSKKTRIINSLVKNLSDFFIFFSAQKTEDAREAEDVDDISTQINDQFRQEQGKVTSTQGTYGPYVREYTSWCHDVEQTSAAVTGPKLAKFIQWKRGEKKTEKLPNGQTRKVEYALKTLKTVASVVIHLWEIQRDHPAVYEGNIYKPARRGFDHCGLLPVRYGEFHHI